MKDEIVCGKCGSPAVKADDIKEAQFRDRPDYHAQRDVWCCSNGACGRIFQRWKGSQVTLAYEPWETIIVESPEGLKVIGRDEANAPAILAAYERRVNQAEAFAVAFNIGDTTKTLLYDNPAAGPWVPVSDRNPEVGQRVLCYTEGGTFIVCDFIPYPQSQNNPAFVDAYAYPSDGILAFSPTVTHWAALNSPYNAPR